MQLPNPKILTIEQAAGRRSDLRAAGRRVVLTNGVFDLLHTGHLHSLQRARALGDFLIVALNSDESVRELKGQHRPVQAEVERAYGLAALECVDAVVVFTEKRLVKVIEALRPDIYVKSGDYSLEKLDPAERAALEAVGTRVEFVPFLPGFSTTALIARIRRAGGV